MSSNVRSSNPFALLGDDGEVAPVAVKAPAAAAAAPKAAATQAKPQAARGGARKPAQAGDVATEGSEPAKFGRDRPAGRGGARGGRGGGRGGANPRSNGGTFLGGDRPRREQGERRVFDRHSATAHKDSDKQTAAGWGAEEGKTELEAEKAGDADAAADGAATPAEAATPRFVEEEDNTQTYDEYLAQQAAKKLALGELPTARVANEGADESQWASAVIRARKGEQEEEWFMGAKKVAEAKAVEKKNKRKVLETEFSFKAPGGDRPPREDRPARGGRGGARGGARGRGARGAARGGAREGGAPRAARAQAPVLDDAASFPSLA